MIIVVFLVVLAISFGICVYAGDRCMDTLEFLTMFTTVLMLIIVIASILILPFIYTGIDGKIAGYEARYESLVYQYENDIYDNDNDLGKRDLMEDIEAWNTDLARKKANQHDFWIGIYIPNIYDQFELIDLG